MSVLDRVREKYRNLQSGTDKADKSPSVSSVGASPKESEKFSALSPDLDRRIRLMAKRWEYSSEELADALDRARRDPAGWSRAVALDERREAEFRECGVLPRADA